MLFNSFAYAVFLPVVLVVYYCLRQRAQNVFLLVASWFFYGWWDYRFLTLLGLSTVVDFFCGQRIADTSNPRVRRSYVLLSLCVNLSILGFFKYFNFFADSARTALETFGLHPSMPTLYIILPMGISFYTFQTLSYTIDVYRGNSRPCRNFITFALYVSYFPQLVAGPIERPARLLPQLMARRKVTRTDVDEGLMLILLGLFKKIAIADTLAPTVDLIFGSPETFSSGTLLLAAYFFSIQIYCDFSGYTDIARGTSRLLGIDLMVNFSQPYFSRSITEFWHRWHISLSTWLRDYLYIPLGGNRHGRAKTYRNLMLTMLLGGLWHGAAWTFVVWGGLHGLYLTVERWVRERRPNNDAAPNRGPLVSLAQMAVTFHLVMLAWIFFRAQSFSVAWDYLSGLAVLQGGESWIGDWEIARFVLMVGVLFTIDWMQYFSGQQIGFLVRRWYIRGAAIGLVSILLIVFGGSNSDVPFIYFQF